MPPLTIIPTVFIPYPYAYKDHQFYNAKRLAENRANIRVIREGEINIENLIGIINHLSDKRLIVRREDATEKIIKKMEEYVWEN